GGTGPPRGTALPAGSSPPRLRGGQAGRAKARSRFPGRSSPAPLPTKTIPRAIAGPPAIGEPGGDSQTGSPSRARQARSFPSIRPMKTRSEEHTSELQSRRDLVCRLLLEKKKKKKQTDIKYKEINRLT